MIERHCMAYGVAFVLRASNAGLLEEAFARAPLTCEACERCDAPVYSIMEQANRVSLDLDGRSLQCATREDALLELGRELMVHVADCAPEHVFVHAGVVAWKGHAFVFPGRSFAGKSTLTAALVRHGATYFSDEYAVFDTEGSVWPYPRPLQMRKPGSANQTPTPVESFGGVAGAGRAPVAKVIFTQSDEARGWNPTTLSPARAVLEMLPHAISARRSHVRVMRVLADVTSRAEVVSSPRGDADELARLLLGV